MRLLPALLLVLIFPASHGLARQRNEQPAQLSDAQKAIIRITLLARVDQDGWCTKGVDNKFVDDLEFLQVDLTDHPVFLVSPGAGCARGGQGANSALWLFDIQSGSPRLLASPEHKAGGWWHAALPHVNNGFHDFDLGWHMSASEYILTTFRFNGHAYIPTRSKTITLSAD